MMEEVLLDKNSKELFKIYCQEISAYAQLSAQDEQLLAERARKGDNQARKRLIEAYLIWVVNIAKRHMRPGVELLDLIQEGNIGLIEAVDKFDPNTGNRLSSLAMFWIRKEIQRYLDGTEEYITSLDMDVEYQGEIVFLSDIIEDQASLLGEPTIEHVETKIEREERQRLINSMLSKLESGEKLVLQLMYGLEGYPRMTREEVAQVIGVGRQYISRIRINALKRLRKVYS